MLSEFHSVLLAVALPAAGVLLGIFIRFPPALRWHRCDDDA